MIAAIALASCMVIANPASKDQSHVHDGDTLTLRCPDRARPFEVRIMEIDAPEMAAFTWKTQPWAEESRNALTALCLNQPASVSLIRYDPRTARWIGRVRCNGTDVAEYQVSRGNAWAFMPSKRSKIPALQEAAHAQGVGIWSLPSPIQPNVWRKGASTCACPP